MLEEDVPHSLPVTGAFWYVPHQTIFLDVCLTSFNSGTSTLSGESSYCPSTPNTLLKLIQHLLSVIIQL